MNDAFNNTRGFYPFEFTAMAVLSTVDSTELTSGALSIGATYVILEAPVGGTPAFDGASVLTKGTVFVATGSSATWGTTTTGKLVAIGSGKPTTIGFFNKDSMVFKWNYIYNEDDYCVNFTVTDEIGNIISKQDYNKQY